MVRYISLLFGAAAGALFVRERRTRRHVERLGAATLESLLDAVDANSPDTGAHVRRVASYSLILADAAGLTDRERHEIERVALFHDIGKLDGAVSDVVQVETGLSPEDWEAVRTHPQKGADVLRPLASFYPELPEGVLAHHERWDGTGYPKQLRGTQIPFTARVVAIADTFDAITHARSYKSAKSFEAAARQIEEGRERQFDPELVDLFLLPPVQKETEACLNSAYAPRRVGNKRSNKRATRETPDINFRWRKPAPRRHREDR